MKTTILKSVMMVLVALSSLNANAYDVEIDGIYYNLDAETHTAEVTNGSYSGGEYTGNVVIPESFIYGGITYSVTSIGSWAMGGDLNSFTSITIPNSVTYIGNGAFYGCSNLTSVSIGNSVESIGAVAFNGCSNLTDVTIPESVTSIAHDAFNGTIWYDNQPNGVIYLDKMLYMYKGEMQENTSVTIKEGTNRINSSAFSGCSGLVSIDIPNSVTFIGSAAFSGTTWLKNQEDGLIYAGKVAYGYKGTMPENTIIKIKEGTTSICAHAFSGCSGLTSVTIPNSVTSIGGKAFSDCI